MTDFRALCVELTDALDKLNCSFNVPNQSRLVERARAALAEPEPEGPTDDDLWDIGERHLWTGTDENVTNDRILTSFIEAARVVRARWGSPAPQPIPVTERLPGPEDCVVISWSELRSPHVWAGKRRLINGPTEIWDWTFASIPWLEESGEFTHWLPASTSVLPAGALRQSNPSA